MLDFLDPHLAHHIQQQIIVLFARVLCEYLHIVDNFDEIAIGQFEQLHFLNSSFNFGLPVISVVDLDVLQHKLHQFIQLKIVTRLELLRSLSFSYYIFDQHSKNIASGIQINIPHIDLNKMSAKSSCKLFIFLVISVSNEDMFGQMMHTFIFQTEYLLVLYDIPQTFFRLVVGHVDVVYVEKYAFMVGIRWIFYQCFLLYELYYFC